ncbi:NADH dehydrogenase subunit N [Candidatus Kryptonium thompsonii]|nr:NADH dehydrogenase subunit N [Candidatus Kryptonium thompsoni]
MEERFIIELTQSLKNFLPEVSLTVTLSLVILLDLIFGRRFKNIGAFVSLAGLVVTLFFTIKQYGGSYQIFRGMFVVDPYSTFFKFVFLLSAFVIVIFSLQSYELRETSARRRIGEYYFFILSLTLGAFLMAGSVNLIMMYLSLELVSISSYILAGYIKESERSSEASMKYVIYGALSSGLMIYGISLVYGLTGELNIYAINASFLSSGYSPIVLMISLVLILAGFGYKISAVPFHYWTPDVYEGAPITVTAFLSVSSKAAGFAMLVRFLKASFIDRTITLGIEGAWAVIQGLPLTEIVAVLSALTMTVGNIIAIWQNNLKRILAYSSIAHAGYILMGVVVMQNLGISAMLIYFLAYLFMNLGAFYCVMLVAEKTGSEDIEVYKGLGYRAPFLSIVFTIFLVSLTGIPPTFGFIGKLYLFSALINAKVIWLAVVGVLNSVVSLYYYIRVVRNMFLGDPESGKEPINFSPAHIVVMLILVIPTLLFGVYFTPIVNFAQISVAMFGLR